MHCSLCHKTGACRCVPYNTCIPDQPVQWVCWPVQAVNWPVQAVNWPVQADICQVHYSRVCIKIAGGETEGHAHPTSSKQTRYVVTLPLCYCDVLDQHRPQCRKFCLILQSLHGHYRMNNISLPRYVVHMSSLVVLFCSIHCHVLDMHAMP